MVPCTGANALSYAASTALQTRLNPQTTPFDVGVPGQTLHEALYQVAPDHDVRGDDQPNESEHRARDAGQRRIGDVLSDLGTFGTGFTQVQAAAALHAQVATVWLGSNDLLKYASRAARCRRPIRPRSTPTS